MAGLRGLLTSALRAPSLTRAWSRPKNTATPVISTFGKIKKGVSQLFLNADPPPLKL